MIYTTGTIAINGNTVTGTGTNFSAPLSLIRVGCTLIAIGNPVQIFTITEIKSGTVLSVTPAANPAIAAGTKFSILLSDSISVDGLAQDVAETLRYYQGRETEIAAAVEWWEEFGGDGQMDQLLATIRAETAKSTANAQKTEDDKKTTEGYKNAAATSATAAKSSQDAAKASETSASNSKTAAATSETNAAKSAADALNYRNQAQGIVGDNIGLGANRRDWPDCNDPTGYIGFCRIEASTAKNFPSIASGELYLVGWLSRGDGATINGCFVGTVTRSLYTYTYNNSNKSVAWARHARKDEVDRFSQIGSDQTRIYAGNGKTYFEMGNDRAWGVYNSETGQWKQLDIAQGGTGARDAATARKNLGLSKDNDLQLRNLNLISSSDVTTGWVVGGQLKSQLLSTSGEQRAEAVLIAETNVTSPSQATIKISTPSEGARYFNFNTRGQILAETAVFRSTYGNPLVINSTTPTISFNENDRPEGSPYYNFVVDGGNWRIQKNGEGYNSEYVIGYNYASDEIEVPNLKVKAISTPKNLDQTKANMLIPYTGTGKWTYYQAPEGAEAGKYYPIIVKHPSHFNGDFLCEIAMRTKSISGSEEPNCNTLHLWVRCAGWSDMGKAAFGHYFCYAKEENAILCVRGTSKGNYEYNAIYVRGDAFPIRLAATVGSTVTIPSSDWSPNAETGIPTYKWGITNSSDGIGIDNYGISNNLLDFTSSATGFYCTDTYRNKYGDSYQVIQPNGIIVPPNGLGLYSDQDWNAQQSDGVNKFKSIAGNVNTPENSLTYGGFHVGFSGSHATQFAGRNSKFYARSFEAGVDKGWKRLLTVDDLNSSTDLSVSSLTTSNPVKSGGGRIDVLGSTSDYSKMDCFVRGFDSSGNSLAWALGSSVGVSKMLSLKNFFSGAEILLNGNDGAVQLKTGNVNGASAQALTINKDEVNSTVDLTLTKQTGTGNRFILQNLGNTELSFAAKVWGSSDRQNVFEVGTSSGYLFYAQKTSAGQLFDVNGAINCTTLNQSSDRDLKDDILVISDATKAIRKMNGYTYTLRENGLPYAGVIAQEVMEALPEAVGSFTHYGKELQGPTVDGNELREETRYLNVDYAAVTGLLVQVARETDNRVTELEEENASLRANIAVMDERITKLEALVRKLTGSEE